MARSKAKRIKLPNGAGSLYLRQDGRWHARYTTTDPDTGLQVRRSLYASSEQEARAKLIRALSDQQRGTLPFTRGRVPTLRQYATGWLARSSTRVKTRHRYRELIELHVLPALGHLRLAGLEAQHVNGLLQTKRAEGLAARTCNHIRAVLRTCLNEAVRENLVGRNAAELARPLPLDDAAAGSVLSAEQVQVLIKAAAKHRDGPLWIVALATGARQSELAGLRWSDIDLDQRTARITRSIQQMPAALREEHGEWLEQATKTRRSTRVVPLAHVALEALRRQRAMQAAAQLGSRHVWPANYGELVFRETDGAPLRAGNVAKRLQYQLTKLGMDRIRFHDLRHSAATFLAVQKVPVAITMAVLGHSSATTTLDIYTRGAPELAREAADAMDRAIDEARR